jgi:hypothetical protein
MQYVTRLENEREKNTRRRVRSVKCEPGRLSPTLRASLDFVVWNIGKAIGTGECQSPCNLVNTHSHVNNSRPRPGSLLFLLIQLASWISRAHSVTAETNLVFIAVAVPRCQGWKLREVETY